MASWLYLPALVLTAGAGLLVGVGWSSAWGGADFGACLKALHAVVAGPLSLALLAAALVLERLRPAQRRGLLSRGQRQDVLYAVLHVTLGLLLVSALSLSFEEVVRRFVPWIVLPRMALVPRAFTIALVLVAVDALNWAAHLADHRFRLLWRFHELHHSQEDLNALTVFRTHPLVAVSYLPALLPGLVLLADGAVPTALLVAYGAMVVLAHSNTDLGFGPLGRILVSPNYHRIHHRLEGTQDVNLGFVLTFWDQLAGRAVRPSPATVGLATGLAGRPLRVEQEGARPRHLATLAAQLWAPFRPAAQPAGLPRPER